MHKEEEKKLQNNIWKTYLFSILSGMFFSIPVMVLFWQENGLSLTQIMILQSVFALIIVALEIPTGYFADQHGRKKSLIISGIGMAGGIIVYYAGHSFAHFIFAEIFFAIAVSFSSGAKSALVYDTLKELGRENEYKKIWGKMIFLSMIALAVTSIFGGLLAKIGLRHTLLASIPFFVVMIPVAFSLYEPRIHKPVLQKGYFSHIINIFAENLLHNKKLRWIIVYSSVVYGFNQASLWLYQPYFSFSGLDVVYFGFVFASFQLVSALSSKYAHIVEKKFGERFSLISMIFLVGASFLLMSNFIFLFSFSFAFLQQFVRGFRSVVVSDYINKLVASDVRATILSVESFLSRLLYALIIPFVGMIADAYTVVQAFTVLGITSLFAGVVMMVIFRKYRII